jgi:hypothetical protein
LVLDLVSLVIIFILGWLVLDYKTYIALSNLYLGLILENILRAISLFFLLRAMFMLVAEIPPSATNKSTALQSAPPTPPHIHKRHYLFAVWAMHGTTSSISQQHHFAGA